MARINLLPWRETRRRERQRQFYALIIASAVAAFFVLFATHVQFYKLIEHQQARNDFLRSEISELDKKIKEIQELEDTKAKILARMDIIQKLQGSRPLVVHMLDDIVKTLPEGVYLSALSQDSSGVTLDGKAESNTRVSAFMRNLDASEWYMDPKLSVIQTKDEQHTRISDFSLVVKPADNRSKQ
jgi:Tfp pilus assembly protein PilN